MVETTVHLIRRQGYNGTGLNQIVEESKAPKGSIYHFFPGGKDHLIEEAVRTGAASFEHQIHKALSEAPSVGEGLHVLISQVISDLKATNFEQGSPISAVALETAFTEGRIQKACSDAFTACQNVIERALRDEGRGPAEARALANLIACAYEGALLLSRTHHDTRPLEEMVETVRRLL